MVYEITPTKKQYNIINIKYVTIQTGIVSNNVPLI